MPRNPEQFEKLTSEEREEEEKTSKIEVEKPIELTKEQDERLLGILRRARRLEKQGNLEEAIKLYQQYKEEYVSLKKEIKEKDRKKTEEARGSEIVSWEKIETLEEIFSKAFENNIYFPSFSQPLKVARQMTLSTA